MVEREGQSDSREEEIMVACAFGSHATESGTLCGICASETALLNLTPIQRRQVEECCKLKLTLNKDFKCDTFTV
jgi:hypothetical protein